MTDRLNAAVANAYRVFSIYRLGTRLAVCKCNVCMDDATEKRLIETPLGELTAGLLAEFTNSAHAEGNADELRYFLPRYFELLAQGQPTSSLNVECSLDRLSYWKWREWPGTEPQVITEFLEALYRARLADAPSVAGFPVDDLAITLARAGFDCTDVLADVIRSGNKRALLNAVSFWSDMYGRKLGNQFWADSKAVEGRIVELLCSTETIKALLDAVDDPADPMLNEQLMAAAEFLSA